MSNNTTDGSAEPHGGTDETAVVSIASVSISQHTTSAISSLGEIRAETAEQAVELALAPTERPTTEGGARKLVLARESVIVPHTEEEAQALKVARKALADAITADKARDIAIAEDKVRSLDTYNLHMDVVDAVCRGVEYDDDGNVTFHGGTIAQMTDFCVSHEGKTRSCINRFGKIASWVRNRESIQPLVTRAVEDRRKRRQDSDAFQAIGHDIIGQSKIMDSFDVVRWKRDDDGVGVGYKVELYADKFNEMLANIAPKHEDAKDVLLSFGAIA